MKRTPMHTVNSTAELYASIDLYLSSPASRSELGEIGSWQIGPSVTDMSQAFDPERDADNTTEELKQARKNFNEDISQWDMSRVTTTDRMFQGNTTFNQDVSGWQLKQLVSAESMFEAAAKFDQHLGKWADHIPWSRVESMNRMFYQASNLGLSTGAWSWTDQIESLPTFSVDMLNSKYKDMFHGTQLLRKPFKVSDETLEFLSGHNEGQEHWTHYQVDVRWEDKYNAGNFDYNDSPFTLQYHFINEDHDCGANTSNEFPEATYSSTADLMFTVLYCKKASTHKTVRIHSILKNTITNETVTNTKVVQFEVDKDEHQIVRLM